MMRCAKFAIKVKSELCGERLSMENLNIQLLFNIGIHSFIQEREMPYCV